MLMTAERPVSAAAVFTTNKTIAAPVVVSRENLEKSNGRARAIVCNSGCANACTGDAGMDVARSTVEFVARQLGCRTEEVLVASTGVIGVDLSLQKVTDGVTKALAALTQRRASQCDARDHDDRSVSKGDGRQRRHRLPARS